MIVLRKLLRRKLVELDHLRSELLCFFKALREQHNLGDKAIGRDHHRDGSEQDFQVVWQLSSALVPWVHCDEHTVRVVDRHLSVVKITDLAVGELGLADVTQLLSDD